MRLADSHCHLDDRQFEADRDQVVARARAAGVEWMLAVGTGDGPPDLEAGLRLAQRYAGVLASAGVHPHDAAKAGEETFERLGELLRHPKIVAAGEIGLDYHYNFSPPQVQRDVFRTQLRLAGLARRPVIIHTREAWGDTLALIRQEWDSSTGGIMHCFSGGPEEAEVCLEMGFQISFAGVVTFPKAARVREAARMVPSERLLVETDAPYLAPVPHRGKRNEPAWVAAVAAELAALRGDLPDRVAAAATDNFLRLCLPGGNGSD